MLVFFFALTVFTLIACVQKETNNKETEPVTEEKIVFPHNVHLPDEGQGNLTTSIFASEVQYIPLETNKNSLLRGVGQIMMNDSIIVVSDFRKLLLFKKDGTFLRQVGRSGKGPGEYSRIFNFELNGDTIYLTSTGKRSVIKYTLDGKFQEEIEVGDQLTHFRVTTGGQIVWYSVEIGELKYYDASMKLINKLRPENLTELPNRWSYWDTFDTYFQISHSKLLFTTYFSDTIWNVSNGRKEAIYIFNLQDKLLPRNLLVNYGQDGDFKKYKKQATRCHKINFMETQNKLFIFQKTWIENDMNTIYIHEIGIDTTRKYTGPFITDDLTSGMKLRIRAENQCLENALIASVNPIDLVTEIEKSDADKTEVYNSWREKMQRVKFDDNPILVIMPIRNKTLKK